MKKDEEVTVIEEINGWVCIEKETAKGWIRADKLMTKEEKEAQEQAAKEAEKQAQTVQKTMYIAETRVNLRKEPNQESESLAKLTLNTQVDVYSEENGWSRVKVTEQKDTYYQVYYQILRKKKKQHQEVLQHQEKHKLQQKQKLKQRKQNKKKVQILLFQEKVQQ